MTRRFNTASLVKTLGLAALLSLAAPAALAAPTAKGHGAKTQTAYKAKPGHGAYKSGPQAVVVSKAPKVVVTKAPKVVFAPGPQVVLTAPRPQFHRPAPRPVEVLPSMALRARLQQARAMRQLNRRELRRLQAAITKLESAERRFLRDDGRFDWRERAQLSVLETRVDIAFRQAFRRA